MQFSVVMELHENCMTSIFGQPGEIRNNNCVYKKNTFW